MASGAEPPSVPPWYQHGRLQVAASGHSLEHADGTAFFMLADTAWHLLSLPEPEMEVYLRDRAAKAFNAVLVDFHAESKTEADADWQSGDALVRLAATHGLYVGIVAGWGSAFRKHSPAQLTACGQRLGRRYRDQPNVFYIAAAEFYKIRPKLDGERLSSTQLQCLAALGEGIRTADDQHLITMHGFPDQGDVGQPATYFHQAKWCDFFAVQTHQFATLIRTHMTHDWQLTAPVKPTLNAEGGYEGADKVLHPWLKKKAAVAIFDSGWGQRFQAYWSVFHGSCGYAYGHDYLWHMRDPEGREGVLHRPALRAPGAECMRHLHTLMEPRIAVAVPAPELISSAAGTDIATDTAPLPDLCCALRAKDGSWAMIYSTIGKSFTLDLTVMNASTLKAKWFDPRSGALRDAERCSSTRDQAFDPPGNKGKDCDWVLLVEAER
jgi:hypothetical protein